MEEFYRKCYEEETQLAKDSGRKVIGKVFQYIDEGGVSCMLTTDDSTRNENGDCEIVVLVQHNRAIRKYKTYFAVSDDEQPPQPCWDIFRFIGESCISPIFYDKNHNLKKFHIGELDKRAMDIADYIIYAYETK